MGAGNPATEFKQGVGKIADGDIQGGAKQAITGTSMSNIVTGGSLEGIQNNTVDAVFNGLNSGAKAFQGVGPKYNEVGGPDGTGVTGVSAPNIPRMSMSAPRISAAPTTAAPATKIAAPTLPANTQISMDNNPFANAQQQLVAQLSQQASGQGPSVAENQLRQGQEATLAATMAQINSARGGASPALARAGLQAAAEQNGKAALDAATARLQEQMAAAGQLGQVAGTARGQDVEIAKANQAAQLDQYKSQIQTAIAQGQISSQEALSALDNNTKIAIQNGNLQQAFQELQAKYALMGLDAQKANQAAAIDLEKIRSDAEIANMNAAIEAQAAKSATQGGILGGLASAVGSVFSDMNLKENITDGTKDVREFLDAIQPYTYTYKDQKHGAGKFTSAMAQDLEKSKLGKDMVVNTNEGKMVNYGHGLGTILAAISDLHKRVTKTEKK